MHLKGVALLSNILVGALRVFEKLGALLKFCKCLLYTDNVGVKMFVLVPIAVFVLDFMFCCTV